MKRAWLLVGAIVVAGCGGMQVESAQDEAVDLTDLATFEWMEREQPEVSRRASREGLDRRIKAAVDLEFGKRGYEKAPSGEGRLVLTYHVGLDGAMDVQLINTLPGDYWGIDRGWIFYTERSVRTLEQGTLVLDAYSADTGKLVWRGVARAEVDRTQSPEKRAELVDKAVRKLAEEFPPRTGS